MAPNLTYQADVFGFAYAGFTLLGGLIGLIKAGSIPSLVRPSPLLVCRGHLIAVIKLRNCSLDSSRAVDRDIVTSRCVAVQLHAVVPRSIVRATTPHIAPMFWMSWK